MLYPLSYEATPAPDTPPGARWQPAARGGLAGGRAACYRAADEVRPDHRLLVGHRPRRGARAGQARLARLRHLPQGRRRRAAARRGAGVPAARLPGRGLDPRRLRRGRRGDRRGAGRAVQQRRLGAARGAGGRADRRLARDLRGELLRLARADAAGDPGDAAARLGAGRAVLLGAGAGGGADAGRLRRDEVRGRGILGRAAAGDARHRRRGRADRARADRNAVSPERAGALRALGREGRHALGGILPPGAGAAALRNRRQAATSWSWGRRR